MGRACNSCSTEVGVAHATRVRHLTSEDALLAEAFDQLAADLLRWLATDKELRRARSGTEMLRALWRRWSDAEERCQFPLLAEIYPLSVRNPESDGNLLKSVVHDWPRSSIEHPPLQDGWPPEAAPAVATVVLAQIRRLQLA